MKYPDEAYLEKKLDWSAGESAEFPFFCKQSGGAELIIRVNDFPAEPMYSLIKDGAAIVDFDDWPNSWKKI